MPTDPGKRTGNTRMPVDASLLRVADASRLAAWFSPAFPIGSFAYSHGLERGVELGVVHDEHSLARWIAGLLHHGTGRTDAILLASAWRASPSPPELHAVAELAAALRPSAELAKETESQGRAFLDTLRATWPAPELEALHEQLEGWQLPATLPVAVGVACRVHGLPLLPSIALHLHAFVANLVSAGVRLVPLGQTAGQRVTAALEREWLAAAEDAVACSLADVAGATPMQEVLSMQHEHQYTRLFQS